MTAEEAKIEETPEGAVASSPGWYVLNLAEARWMRSEEGGEWADFAPEFEQYAKEMNAYGEQVRRLQPEIEKSTRELLKRLNLREKIRQL